MSDRKPTSPITIPTRQSRHRSASLSSTGSADSGSYSPPLQTPLSSQSPKVSNAPSASPPSSPILSYFFHTPPKSVPNVTAATPGSLGSLSRSFGASKPPATDVVIEEEDDAHHEKDFEPFIVQHARRFSTSFGNTRFPQIPSQPQPVSEAQQERGAGLLRRLSLGSALVRPQVANMPNAPPPTPAKAPTVPSPPRMRTPPKESAPPAPRVGRKIRRSATISEGRPPRAPSPMGERILKGQFDGFN